MATAAALGAAAVAAAAPASSAVPGDPLPGLRGPFASTPWINYAAPKVEKPARDSEIGVADRKQTAIDRAYEIDAKHAGGNPVTAAQLARGEQLAVMHDADPRDFKQAPKTQQAKLLTILVEFDDTATDDFSGVQVPASVFGDRTCAPAPAGTVMSGPLHNQIPDPALSGRDNNTFWVPDFSPEHFDTMLFTSEGITERVRPDLIGPDGRPGIDISGYTMKNMYEEMSKGAYTVDGAATNWVKVDHSEAWYAADTCTKDTETGEWVAGAPQDMNGHPENPGGAATLAVDAVKALSEQQPDFPFADYDIEDQGDLNGDGNFYEPDGIIDHVVLVHAGEDKSGGGGAQGTYAIWAHSSSVPGGAEIPGQGLKVSNYIVQPEDSGVGVFAHEYGHDLGLPDLYDTSSGGDSDVDFWDLMSSGSHSGPVFQSMPTHMGLWDKWVLGWAEPRTFAPGDAVETVEVGQTSRTPVGTEDGIKIDLPTKVVTVATPESGSDMWWSGNDQDWAKNTLTRSVTVPATGDNRFWMSNNYVIEEDWDFGFVEVSTDGGTTWTEQVVRDETGAAVTTPADYGDPNGRMHDFGDKKHGLTGSSDGWSRDYVDLTPFAGTVIQLRLLYATDEAFVERGWFADDFAQTSDDTVVWSDPVEGDVDDWAANVDTFLPGSELGTGWHLDTGTQAKSHYYLAEWRNFDGFDNGLRYAYDTTYADSGPWKVEKVAYNAPGMLVWYRDTTYGNQNPVLATTYDLPSAGSKGGLLVVDANYEPLRRSGKAAQLDPSTLDNLPSRPQSSNAAFGPVGQYPFRECLGDVSPTNPYAEYCTSYAARSGITSFTDAVTWYPGIEIRGQRLFFRDRDASVVIPSRGAEIYSTRVVNANGTPLHKWYGTDLGLGSLLGTGNPVDGDFDASDGPEDLRIGVDISVVKRAKDNMSAAIKVRPAPAG